MNDKETVNPNEAPHVYPYRRVKLGVIFTLVGFLILLLGAKPSIFGMDRSPVIGFVQTATFLVGLALICLGGYFALMGFWPKGYTSITADSGIRLVTTGLTIALFSGMADVFGVGSHPIPGVPFFGPLQSLGVVIGEMVIGVGLCMMILPPHHLLKSVQEDTVVKIEMDEQNK